MRVAEPDVPGKPQSSNSRCSPSYGVGQPTGKEHAEMVTLSRFIQEWMFWKWFYVQGIYGDNVTRSTLEWAFR